jgi:hypothetical protein
MRIALIIFFGLLIIIFNGSPFSPVQAADRALGMGPPNLFGKGCPKGTVSATLSPDQKALSVIFDRYEVEMGALKHAQTGSATCSIQVPLEVPKGYFLMISKIVYRGFHSLPEDGKSYFTSQESFWAEDQFISESKQRTWRFTGPRDQDFVVSKKLTTPIHSECGGEVQLYLWSRIGLKTNSHFDSALVSMDSVDITVHRIQGPHVELKFLLIPC